MNNRGFSLLELIIVMILLSLSLALVTPSLSRFSKAAELRGAVQNVSGILRYGRSEAVHKGQIYQVLFDPNLKEVRVQSMESTEEKGEDEKERGKMTKKIYHLPAGVQIKEDPASSLQNPPGLPLIEFYPNGASNGGTIFLNHKGHQEFKIEVHYITGMVKVEQK